MVASGAAAACGGAGCEVGPDVCVVVIVCRRLCCRTVVFGANASEGDLVT